MLRDRSWSSSSGFSLAEVMVAAGLLGVLALVSTRLMGLNTKSAKILKLEVRSLQ